MTVPLTTSPNSKTLRFNVDSNEQQPIDCDSSKEGVYSGMPIDGLSESAQDWTYGVLAKP